MRALRTPIETSQCKALFAFDAAYTANEWGQSSITSPLLRWLREEKLLPAGIRCVELRVAPSPSLLSLPTLRLIRPSLDLQRFADVVPGLDTLAMLGVVINLTEAGELSVDFAKTDPQYALLVERFKHEALPLLERQVAETYLEVCRLCDVVESALPRAAGQFGFVERLRTAPSKLFAQLADAAD